MPRSAPLPESLGQLQTALAGRYEIVRELGEGAFANVYIARDLRHERDVAIKVLREDASSEIPEFRFIREIRVLATLQHPHILPLIDSGHVGTSLYYVSPYVRGESLRQAISRERMLPIPVAVEIAREVADALHYAHCSGVIHRDVKPENILLSDWHAIVADFGIAQLAGGKNLLRKITYTRDGTPGTPAYMSPEQIFGSSEVDVRADVYSLGCVLFEMLTGRSPFDSVTSLAERLTANPPNVRALRPEAPEALGEVIARSLSPNARDRFQTAAEFARALRGGDARVVEPHADAPTAHSAGDPGGRPSPAYTEARELYLRASEVVHRRAMSQLSIAFTQLRRAVELDPHFAPAHTALGIVHLLRADLEEPIDVACTAAEDSAARALKDDPSHGEAHAVRGLAATFMWQWDVAAEAFAKACRHGADSALVHHWNGLHLCTRGQLTEAVNAFQEALRLGGNPLALHLAMGLVNFYARNFDGALECYREAETADPTAPMAPLLAGMAESAKGNVDSGLRWYQHAVDLAGQFTPFAIAAYGCALAASGRMSEATRRREELTALSRRADISPFYEASVAAAVGDHSSAIALLLRAQVRKDTWLLSMAVHPWMVPLHGQQGYQDVVQEIGLRAAEASCNPTSRT